MERLFLRAKQALVQGYSRVGQAAIAPILYYEWTRRSTRRLNERPVEYAHTLAALADSRTATILDVGTGRTAWPQLLADCGYAVTAIDEMENYWGGLFLNRHHWVVRQDVTHASLIERFDAVTCLSVLEHIADESRAVEGIARLLAPGGIAILSFPYNEDRFVENVYAEHGVGYGHDAPYICRVYSRQRVDGWLQATGLTVREQRYFEVFSGALWAFGDRVRPIREVRQDERHHLTWLVLEKPATI